MSNITPDSADAFLGAPRSSSPRAANDLSWSSSAARPCSPWAWSSERRRTSTSSPSALTETWRAPTHCPSASSWLAISSPARLLTPASLAQPGPSQALEFGLPDGFVDRLERRDYGPSLAVYFASRYDQIHFKLYAAVDEGGPGKHEADLRALAPTEAELIAAARWSRSHDPSPGYAEELRGALEFLGVSDVDLGT
jgi:hypothetical protein